MASKTNSYQVKDLIAMLSDCDPDAQVRLAFQPRYPFEYRVGEVVEVTEEDGRQFVYIAEGGQLDYLSSVAREALEWD